MEKGADLGREKEGIGEGGEGTKEEGKLHRSGDGTAAKGAKHSRDRRGQSKDMLQDRRLRTQAGGGRGRSVPSLENILLQNVN